MKKVILLTACTAAVLLSGCSDNELASVGDGIGTSTQSAIGFHVVGNQAETRAIPITPLRLVPIQRYRQKVHTKQKPAVRMHRLSCVLMTGLFLFLFL